MTKLALAEPSSVDGVQSPPDKEKPGGTVADLAAMRSFGCYDDPDPDNVVTLAAPGDLQAGSATPGLFSYGWNEPEPDGCWSKERRAGIRFAHRRTADRKQFQVALRIVFLRQNAFPQRMQIWRRDRCLINVKIEDGGRHEFVVSLPDGTAGQSDLIDLRLFYSHLRVPGEANDRLSDPRHLGFRLERVGLRDASALRLGLNRGRLRRMFGRPPTVHVTQ